MFLLEIWKFNLLIVACCLENYFFLEGKIGLYNLSKMLEEDNLKALENQVEQDIANGIISSNKDELNLET